MQGNSFLPYMGRGGKFGMFYDPVAAGVFSAQLWVLGMFYSSVWKINFSSPSYKAVHVFS